MVPSIAVRLYAGCGGPPRSRLEVLVLKTNTGCPSTTLFSRSRRTMTLRNWNWNSCVRTRAQPMASCRRRFICGTSSSAVSRASPWQVPPEECFLPRQTPRRWSRTEPTLRGRSTARRPADVGRCSRALLEPRALRACRFVTVRRKLRQVDSLER